MIKSLGRFTREILVAVLFGFSASSIIYFVSPKLFNLEAFSVYLLLLVCGCISAAISISLMQKRLGHHLASLFTKVDNISIGTAEISHNLDILKKKISIQAQLSSDSAEIIKQVSVDSEYLSSMSDATVDAASGTRSESSQGSHDVEEIIEKIESANIVAKNASDSVDKLLITSKKIEKITEFVHGIATTTNLLSLNAAISAAQAGEHGKSFAVIATEIRKLSLQTTQAIQEINSTLQEIQTGTKDSANAMVQLTGKISGIVETSNQIRQILLGINNTAMTTGQQSSQMASALVEYVGTTNEVSSNILNVKDSLEMIANQSKLASEQSLGLTHITEEIQAALFKFGITENKHESVWQIANRVSKLVGKSFEQAIASGALSEADVFDQNYLPIHGTNPPKYHTKFDNFTDAVLPNLQEPALNELDALVFVIATDVNGYVPTHNIKFSEAVTGHYEVDLANSRSKRIFSDRVGKRCGSHTEELLLQTYKRDTGEIMHDLSVPVFVNNRHWGGVRVGYLAGLNQLTINHKRLN
jgi:methyl-accepting chemotaxis protein